MQVLDVGIEFAPSLTNRDDHQRDGRHSGVEFRERYLKDLENENNWPGDAPFIALDFSHVKRLGPSWSNEVFAYFTKFANPEEILRQIKLVNISRVKESIIRKEIETGYSRK